MKDSPIDMVEATKRLGPGEPVNKEQTFERLSVERLSTRREAISIHSMNITAEVPKRNSKTRKSCRKSIKSRYFKDGAAKLEAVASLARAASGLSIGQVWGVDAVKVQKHL